MSPPILDDDNHEMVFLVGGLSADRTTLKPSTVDIEIDGRPAPARKATEVFSEYAQAAAEANKRWKPPLAVGLVYLWVKDIPAGIADAILEGLSGFLRRIPARTNVYATLYGRKRQPIPRLKASEIASQLHDIGYLGGDRPNLADAIRLDLRALLGDDSPFKVLVVVTDGRDHDDYQGESSADFVALADEIRNAGVQLMVVSFAPFEADAERSRKNLVHLGSSGAVRRAIESPLGMQAALEALGQAIADMRRVRLDIPWGWRNFGGTRRIRLDVAIDGRQRVIEVGEVTLPARKKPWLVAFGVLLGTLAVAAGAVLYWRRRSVRPGDREDEDSSPVVAAAHSLIARGLSAPRALVELTRSFPKEVSTLATLDASVFADERFPLFRTRPGRRRLEELRALLAHEAGDDGLLGEELAEVLSRSISSGAPAEQVASNIAARVPEDQWGAFSRMALDDLAYALRASGARYPVLASPHARGVALEIQAALRSEGRNVGRVVAVGWLVRVAGQGERGETVRLPAGRAVLGRAPGCSLRMDGDTQIAARHAAIVEQHGAFFIQSVQGEVRVEARPVRGSAPLSDGDTIAIGRSQFVFKCVSSGHAGPS
ncbi:MAG: VWA domain-containing protein [Deltaproteobacteria bacterium]|nr:VWA domain-containing protein [Deltaproteobacteria bacterium]